MTKSELRKIYLQKRVALSEADCFLFNRGIYDIFFTAVDLSFIRVLHTFLPINGSKEPDTWLIIDRIRREYPHIQLSVPRVGGADGLLENFNFEGLHQLHESAWGIPEPRPGIPTPTEKIDMVLVPLLVADRHGDRVGYGKGFYDRFLSSCRKDCVTIGLSFFPLVESIDDVASYDIKLSSVITPSEFFSF